MSAASSVEPQLGRPRSVPLSFLAPDNKREQRFDSYDPVFALVSYLPDSLATYLDELRSRLVPTNCLVSHLTILPPRPISHTPEAAFQQILEQSKLFGPFEVELGEVEIFDASSVIYIGLKRGRERLVEMHDALNVQDLDYKEPWPFHPHITLAQNFDPVQLAEKKAIAEQVWAAWPGSRKVMVEKVCFVQRTNCQNWASLACCRL
jgi:2'-5' RNA ligase